MKNIDIFLVINLKKVQKMFSPEKRGLRKKSIFNLTQKIYGLRKNLKFKKRLDFFHNFLKPMKKKSNFDHFDKKIVIASFSLFE